VSFESTTAGNLAKAEGLKELRDKTGEWSKKSLTLCLSPHLIAVLQEQHSPHLDLIHTMLPLRHRLSLELGQQGYQE